MPDPLTSDPSMDRLFFDTNVLLDVLEQRAPWFPESFACLAQVESGTSHGALSALSLSDIAYIQNGTPASTLYKAFRNLRTFLDIAPMTGEVIDAALARGMRDIEDGFQLEAALPWGATHLITRNTGDFPRDTALRIRSPLDYLA